MDLSNASLLSFQKNNEFLDSSFRFGSRVSYEIQGNFLDLENDVGVSGLISASEFFRTGLQDYQPIILNGTDFGKGRVLGFTTNDAGSLKYSTYNLSIEGFQSGNLSNLSGKYYSGLSPLVTGDTRLEAPDLLEQFSEDFSIDRNGSSFSYNHNLNIKYASGDGVIITPIQRAKGLAAEIFKNIEPPFELLDHFSGKNFFTGAVNEKFNESYDLINNSVNLSRNFTVNTLDEEKYSVRRSQNFTKSAEGEISISEQSDIKAKSLFIEADLSEAVKLELASSYGRCSGIYDAYTSNLILPSGSVNTSQSIDNFLGEASYSITFTDSNDNLNEKYIFNLNHSIARSDDIIKISEQGSIMGKGSSNDEKMINSLDAYNIEKLNVLDRSRGFYVDRGGSKTLKLESVSLSKDTESNSLQYTYSFSDDDTLVNGRRIEISISNQDSIDKSNTFSSLGVKEFVQKINTTTQGSRTVRIVIKGNQADTLDVLLLEAKAIANNIVEVTNDTYIDNASYSFDLDEKVLQLSVGYNFNNLFRGQQLL